MVSATGEDALIAVEMTTKDLEYHINLVDKAAAQFERIDPSIKRSSSVGKMLSNNITYYKETMKGKVNHCDKLHCFPILATITQISQQLSTSMQDPLPAKRS